MTDQQPVTVKILPDDTKAMIGRTLVAFGVAAVTAVALVYIQRKASSPDFLNITRMRTLNLISKYADNRIDFWQDVAGKVKTAKLTMAP